MAFIVKNAVEANVDYKFDMLAFSCKEKHQ